MGLLAYTTCENLVKLHLWIANEYYSWVFQFFHGCDFMAYKPMKTHLFMGFSWVHYFAAAFHGYYITEKNYQLQLSWVFYRISW